MVALWALPGRAILSWPVGALLAGVSATYLEHPAHLVSKTTAGKLHILSQFKPVLVHGFKECMKNMLKYACMVQCRSRAVLQESNLM